MFKVALYTRVSTEEQAENPEGSIKNQEQRLREFVKLKNLIAPFGDVVAVYSDPGVSAKDMNRPAFQKLLQAIESRQVTAVVVTELSRFTRSMRDFCLLQDFLKRYGCQFVSMRENFDTSTATGNLVMTIMATLAEFERQQTAERISNSFLERAKRGLYNGGAVPLGYRVDEVRPGNLVVVEEEAALIRQIFETFLKEETLAATAKRLNAEKVPFPRIMRSCGGVRGRLWRLSMLHKLMTNRSYMGVRVFHDKKGERHETEAAWEPIVDREVFDRAARLLAKNRNHKRTHGTTRYPYTLSGVLFCRTCGHRLAGKSAHGRGGKIAYYDHSYALKTRANVTEKVAICDGEHHRIQAARIEPLVWQDVKEFVAGGLAQELLAKARAVKVVDPRKARREKLEASASKADAQIEALAERIAALPRGLDPKALYVHLERLQESKAALLEDLAEAKEAAAPADEYVSVENLEAFTAGLKKQLDLGDQNPEVQAAIIRKIVERIDVLPEGYEISFHVGMNHYRAGLGIIPGPALFRLGEKTKGSTSAPTRGMRRPAFLASGEKSVTGSTLFLNGGR